MPKGVYDRGKPPYDWRNRDPQKHREAAMRHYWKNREKISALNKSDKRRARRLENARRSRGVKNPTGENRFGICEICKTESKLVLDHDHATGAHRGWICSSCNHGIGFFRDNCDYLKEAIEYLARSRQDA